MFNCFMFDSTAAYTWSQFQKKMPIVVLYVNRTIVWKRRYIGMEKKVNTTIVLFQ